MKPWAGWCRLAATVGLLALPAWALAQTNLLANTKAWTLAAGTLEGDTLTLQAMTSGPGDPGVGRETNLPPGNAWGLSLKLALGGSDAGGGASVSVHSPDGRWLAVALDGATRSVQMLTGDDDASELIAQSKATPAWLPGPEQPVRLRYEGGRLQVYLGDQLVLHGPVVDLEPEHLGLRATGATARVRELQLQALGPDGRLARLSGATAMPGRTVLFEERWAGKATALASGLLARLTGSADKAANSDAWGKNWSDAEDRFERKTSTRRLTLQGFKDDGVSWLGPAADDFPLDHATVAVTARLRFKVPDGDDHSAGLYIRARDTVDAQRPDDTSLVYASVRGGWLRLHHYDPSTRAWKRLRAFEWAGSQGEATLRLVLRDMRVWLFADGRLLMAESLPTPFKRVNGAGLRVEGRGLVEASSFVINEL